MTIRGFLKLIGCASTLLAQVCLSAQATSQCPGAATGEKHVFWGDLHVHTSYSMDAYAVGVRTDPGDAFRFAKGQELTLADSHTRVKLDRPLDFTAVTDHAENFGVMYLCTDPEYRDNAYCREFRETSTSSGTLTAFRKFFVPITTGDRSEEAPFCDTGADCVAARASQWTRVQHYANEANEPCRFTAFVGNEWSATPNNRHWHRNLIFATDKVTAHPINAVDQPTVEQMWGALERECRAEDGCDVIAIPHNMNLGEGGSFDVERASDADLKRRMRYERLAEIFQHKGSSECLPKLGADDDDCAFELMLHPRFMKDGHPNISPEQWNLFRRTFYRSLLARGLVTFEKRGVNPLELGVVASTDTHNATAGFVAESGWKGHFGADFAASVRFSLFPDANPGGLVAVWAQENTRGSLFAALKRRESYATSGPRITLKFFATWEPRGDPCRGNFAGREDTVMGGELRTRGRAKPRFVVDALQDRTPLARIDIVRGRLVRGEVEERVFSFPAASASGKPALCVAFRDNDYDASVPTYWYARVLEMPTPRWSKYDCEASNSCAQWPRMDRMIQERAWSSPIWRLP